MSPAPRTNRVRIGLVEADRFDDLLNLLLEFGAGVLVGLSFDEEQLPIHIDDPYPDPVAQPRGLPHRTTRLRFPVVEEPRVATDVLANGEHHVLRGTPAHDNVRRPRD